MISIAPDGDHSGDAERDHCSGCSSRNDPAPRRFEAPVGKVCLEASANTDLIADVAGYFPAGSDYTPTASPVRILDTRATAPVTADAPLRVGVAGRAGVPGDALAVVMNVTATGAAGPGYVTVYPCTPTPPDASNLNYVSGQDIPNLVVARINASGEVCMFSSTAVNLIADVAGYFPAGSGYTPTVSPVRILDTRSGLGAPPQPVAAGTTVELQVGGNGGVPGDASAVVMNVTVSAGPNSGYVTVFPCGQNLPEASNLNYSGGQAIPNLVVARLGVAGRVCLFTSADADLIADVAGYFPAGSDYTATATPVRILDTRSIPAPTPPPVAPAPPPAAPTPPPTTTAPPASSLTPSQQQAVKKAESYLSFTSFSRQGLIDQLVFEKFSVGDATIAVDSLNVDWNAQAVVVPELHVFLAAGLD